MIMANHMGGDVLSRHRTSDGFVTYTRCSCGALNVWIETAAGIESLVASSNPDHYPNEDMSSTPTTCSVATNYP